MDSTVSVVLVTNVGQGFGRAVALALGQADYDVVCADKDVDLAAKTAAEIEELGGQAIPIAADMTTQLDVQHAFDKVFEIFGDLSGVVHVAPFESHSRFRELAEGELAELLDETFKSSLLTLRTAARMLNRSWLVLVGPPSTADEPHMAAMRGAMSELVRSVGERFGSLRVNVIEPSRAASDPVHDAALVDSVIYLGTEAGRGLSGQTLKVKLPPPPQVIESLLPEVQAALDENTRQDDLEASLYDADAPGLLGEEASEDGETDFARGGEHWDGEDEQEEGWYLADGEENWEPSGDGDPEDADEEAGLLQRISFSGRLPRDSN